MSRHNGLIPVILIIFCVGCAERSLIRFPGKLITEFIPGQHSRHPARLLCLWEPAEGLGIRGQPSRGFAGQILFFDYGNPSPIPVHGTVNIYQYDNYDPEELNPRPIHVFTFDDTGWNAHRIDSTVGQSYNVFIPYIRHHSGPAVCGLKVEFIGEDGRLVSSAVTELTLQPKMVQSPIQSALRRNILRHERTSHLALAQPVPAEAHEADTRTDSDPLDSLTIPLSSRNR